MGGYGQFCPVAKAAEVLTERWTPLVVRELLCGSSRFNDIRRGVPLMSPSLLSTRLKSLESAGVVERHRAEDGRSWEYRLTRAGEELRPIVEQLGQWGNRWVTHELTHDEIDPALLLWNMRRWIRREPLPRGRVVIEIELWGAPAAKRRWWLVFDRGDVDLCLTSPGHEVDLRVSADLRAMADLHLGKRTVTAAVRDGLLELSGPRALAQRFRRWLTLGPFAARPTQR